MYTLQSHNKTKIHLTVVYNDVAQNAAQRLAIRSMISVKYATGFLQIMSSLMLNNKRLDLQT